ncbi:hypothetical protein Dda_2641 [Drechslerella dactyloides]|uniref:Uncharacterized protein n=1 Tax=Drechslerella dactyloides TaxID=74499 RepID=A0AAD6J0T6_DREDA|nr:hypothetical protein Dda_2641 [Drechslerella dactyloides]
MLKHLESGTCPSHITCADVNAVFALHPDAEVLLRKDCKQTLRAFLNREKPDAYAYRCYGGENSAGYFEMCGEKFEFLSDLLLHVQSNDCCASFRRGGGRIIPFLKRNLHVETAIFKIETLRVKLLHKSRWLIFDAVGQNLTKMGDLGQQYQHLRDGLRGCLEYVQTQRLENSSETPTITCDPLLFQENSFGLGILQKLGKILEALISDYEAIGISESKSPAARVLLYNELINNAQMLDAFLREADAVLKLLRIQSDLE